MAHLTVTVALLFIACVHAAPAPEPSNPKFTFVKDSSLGLGVAGQNGKAHGVVNSNIGLDTPIEAPVDTGNNVPDVTVVDNVNVGAAFADSGNVATGVHKNNNFANDPTEAPEPSNPKFTFAKDSALGLGVAGSKSKALGVVESNKGLDTPMEAPVDPGNNEHDVTVLENLNAGLSFGARGSIATGVLKNNKFADDPTKGSLLSNA